MAMCGRDTGEVNLRPRRETWRKNAFLSATQFIEYSQVILLLLIGNVVTRRLPRAVIRRPYSPGRDNPAALPGRI
jgi:hypothetical protein